MFFWGEIVVFSKCFFGHLRQIQEEKPKLRLGAVASYQKAGDVFRSGGGGRQGVDV